jgi:ABC-type transporter Mla maintaining outer membrane lipid asymmetry ATPase subunit MlaF
MNAATPSNAIVEIRGLHTRFGTAMVHEDVSFSVGRGEVFALVGASGCCNCPRRVRSACSGARWWG